MGERRAAAEVAAETAAVARVERSAEARSRALAESCRRVFADPRVEAVSRVPGVLHADEIEWAITFAPRGEIRRRTFYGPSIDAAYAKAVEADRVVVNEQKRRR